MANAETQAMVQDSIEKWAIVKEFCKRWNQDFDLRMERERVFRKNLFKAVEDINQEVSHADR